MMPLKRIIFDKFKLEAVFNRSPTALFDEVGSQIEIDQFMAWVRHSYVMYPVGILGMFGLLFEFSDKWKDDWIRLSAGCLLVSYVTMIMVSSAWLRSDRYKETYTDLKKIRFKMGIVRSAIGSSWGLLLIALMAVADPNQRALLYGTGVALMSTGIFGGSVIYGLTFWLPITIGFWFALISDYKITGFPPIFCFFLYGILTLYSIFYLSGKVRALAVNGFELKTRNDIIGLVLHEFEEDSSDWLWETDKDFTLKNLSPRFESVLGQQNTTASVNLRSLLLADVPLSDDGNDIDTFTQKLLQHQSFRKLTLSVMVKGKQCWWLLSGKPKFTRKGVFIGYQGVGSDVTEAHGFRQKIDYLARYDALTNLYNRAQFNEALDRMFEISPAIQEPFCLITLDLDNFKGVNDTYGHSAGDELLSAVAGRILGCIRDEDVAARLGGDEFCVILPYQTQREGETVACRIIEALSKPFLVKSFRINAGASAGIAYVPQDGSSAKELLRRADIALYQAKNNGRGTYCSYSEIFERKLEERQALEADLRLAIDREEFVLFFQPIFDLGNERIVGAEALLRWQHPTRGLLNPGSFIELAESTGLIEPMGLWVIAEACRIGTSLPSEIKIAINLSPLQLRDHKLPGRVARVLQDSGIKPERIEFEITESAILETSGLSSTTLQELKGLGTRLALDDFGTGHSSLSLLRRFRFDRIKIDKSFTSGLTIDKTDTILVDQVIDLTKKLGLDVTVEGVETVEQAGFLRKYAGISVQGHLFGHADKVEALAKYFLAEKLWKRFIELKK